MQVLSASKQELVAKFGRPATAQIVHFQSEGKPMKLSYGGSVAGVGPDLNDGDITTVRSTGSQGDDPGYDDLTRTLAQVQALHRQAIQIITDYETRQKAKPNPSGSTGSARQISRPKNPGPRGDLI
jgi:hypothetical protein